MIATGLVEETIALRKLYNPKLSAMTSIGYKEIGAYLDGDLTLLQATELIKKHTRNYAKRQLTWFRRYQDVEYV
jgi:tRNA dimethylallyltransferase